MSADLLHEAAALMRERAQAATAGPWHWEGDRGSHGFFRLVNAEPEPDTHDPDASQAWERRTVADGTASDEWGAQVEITDANATHIASWPPAVALAVADWLDSHAAAHVVHDPRALAAARIYLGRDE